MLKLSERYPGAALITGASAGIGKAFAQHCAADGMDVVLVARRRRRLEILANDLERSCGVRTLVVEADLSAADAPQQIKKACDEAGFTISLLVNNAGFGTFSAFHETDINSHLALVDVNMRAPVALSNYFVPAMVERKNGAVVFVSSTAGFQPTPMLAVYGATKAFNQMLGEALWHELKPHGVDAIALAPGYTRTEFHRVARVHKLPSEERFRSPEHVVATCFKALGHQASVTDRVGELEARRARAKAKMNKVIAGLGYVLKATASAGMLHLADMAVLF